MVGPLHVQNELKYGLEINKVYNELYDRNGENQR